MALDLDMAGDLDVMFDDHPRAATFKHGGSHSVDLGTQTETEAYTDESITVISRLVSEREIAASGGKFVEGDRRFLIRSAELTLGDPAADSRIVLGADTWEVFAWSLDSRSKLWRVTARLH
jgi:hypothetical protein